MNSKILFQDCFRARKNGLEMFENMSFFTSGPKCGKVLKFASEAKAPQIFVRVAHKGLGTL